MNLDTPITPSDSVVHERPKIRVGSHARNGCDPEIHVQKKGNVIEAITVICSCGEEIKINCHYTDAA